jgi:hypothetical protein
MATSTKVQRQSAFGMPWPYVGVALVSALTCVVTFGLTLSLGIVIGVVGSVRGAVSKTERGRSQGVHTLLVGLSFLVGPLAYLLLAIAN